MTFSRVALGGVVLGMFVVVGPTPGLAQPGGAGGGQGGGQGAGQPAAWANEPVQVRLGRRVEQVRLRAGVCEELVLVQDAASYREAIARWTPERRYPVLIDDGSLETRELIACFARGFRPARVVRWRAPGVAGDGYDRDSFARSSVDDLTGVIARAWGVPAGGDAGAAEDALIARWREVGHVPPGVVLMGVDDPAWTAGVALAAGHGQVPSFLAARQGVDTTIGAPETVLMLRATERAAEASGFSWRGLGDDLDAITIAMNTPNRYDTGKELLAMSDRLGRHGEPAQPGARWAWAGQVFGSPARAAYGAMCALFLQPGDAWLFDGYPNEAPFDRFDATQAGAILREGGLRVEVIDAPRASSWDWRTRVARPIEGGVVLVNTRGNDDFFELNSGRALPGDVPVLRTPALATIVHSWSATAPGNRDRLAGRWLERGVFAYAGSVHEPFLGAFVPTPMLAGRLRAGAPFGVAARLDGGPWWKITILGDPLYTLGAPARRLAEGAGLEGATDVGAGLRDALTGERYAEAMRALALTGRDAEIVRLGEALLEQKPGALDSEAAAALVPALFREGRTALVWRAYQRLDATRSRDPILRDVLWLSVTPLVQGESDPALLHLLRANIRAFQGVRDAMLLARAWERVHGADRATGMLREVREQLPTQAEREELDRLMREPSNTWGR